MNLKDIASKLQMKEPNLTTKKREELGILFSSYLCELLIEMGAKDIVRGERK
jgi:AraC-like DNA-binding protein